MRNVMYYGIYVDFFGNFSCILGFVIKFYYQQVGNDSLVGQQVIYIDF